MTEAAAPNIILLFPDQWRGDCLSHLQHPDARTPWVDEMARSGISYTRAFSPAPTCIPARMALLTGMSPWANGRTGYQECVDWRPPHSLPGLLRDAGYQTVQVGKTHFHPMRAHLGFEIHDAYEASVREDGYISDYQRELTAALPLAEDAALRRHPNAWTVTPWTHERAWHNTEWITRRAIERLRNRDPQRPIFMQIDWHRPHPPFDPPSDLWQEWIQRPVSDPVCGDWLEGTPVGTAAQLFARRPNNLPADQVQEVRRAYLASIAHVDEQLGRILWAVQKLNMQHNTWIVFASDHGEMLGDHGYWHKGMPLQASARVPMVVQPPLGQQCERGIVDDRPTTLTDLLPSFLQLAHVPVPSCCDGVSLWDQQRPAQVHVEHQFRRDGWHAIMDERWAYHWYVSGREALFDHQQDPWECCDLQASRPDQLGDMRTRLIQHLQQRQCGTVVDGQLQCGHYLGEVQPREFSSR